MGTENRNCGLYPAPGALARGRNLRPDLHDTTAPDGAIPVYADKAMDLRPGIGLTHRGYTLARAAEPNPETKDGLDAIHVPRSFSLFDTRVIGNGTESFWIRFALYTLAPDGETQKFHSYYEWDPTITTLAL
ncbi:AidA/PixA family protein [Burkholderia anthina]|nr:AidA/PixA family protein [Burkholderia anthina]